MVFCVSTCLFVLHLCILNKKKGEQQLFSPLMENTEQERGFLNSVVLF